MIWYDLKRGRQSTRDFLDLGFDEFTVSKSEKQKYLDKGWKIVRIRYFIITSFIDWWSKFKIEVKLSIITMFIGAFYFFLSMCLDNRYADLEDNYESLDERYIQLNKTLKMTSDSLKVERNLSQYLRKELKIKTTKN
tara:strand:- start:60 stop:470 length:411 start_codon:yes stop_codon:yes gene_type:complete